MNHHQQRITCLSANDDNSLLAGGSWRTIWLWRLKPQYELIKLDGHEAWVTSVALSGNSRYLVSSGEDNVVNVWDVKKRSLLWKDSHINNEINAIIISKDNKLIIGGSDKSIRILDIATQKSEKILKAHSKAVTCLAISPDGRLLFSGSSDKTIKIWDLQKQEYIYEIKDNRSEITCLSISFMEQKLILASGSSDGTVNIFEINKDIKKGNLLDRFNVLKFNYKLIRSYSDFPHSIQLICSVDDKLVGFNLKNQLKYWCYKLNLSETLNQIENVNDILITQNKKSVICATDKWLELVSLSGRENIPIINLKSLVIYSDKNSTIEVKNSCQFYLQATTLTEDQFYIDNLYLEWQTEGGVITSQGLFVAGEKEGTFHIKVKDKFGFIELSTPIKIVKTPPYLNKLEFVIFSGVLESKQEFIFVIKGIDQYNQFFKAENIQWSVNHGQIDNHGRFFVDNFIGTVKLKAIARDVKNNRDIVVEKTIEIIEPAKLNQLVIAPNNNSNRFSLQPGEEKEFVIIGLDQYHKPIQTGELIWQLENISESCLQNIKNDNSRILKIPQDFKGKIKLIIRAVEKDVDLTVNIEVPSVLKQLIIEPSENLVLKPDEVQKFNVKGFNQCGDPISTNNVTWLASNNQIDRNGEFKADYTSREVRVSASLNNITCSVLIKILPVLNSLKINPQVSELLVYSEQQFTVQGYDQFGDLCPLKKVSWKSSHNLITNNGYFTAGSETINDRVTVLADGKNYSFDLQVYEPSHFTKLLLSPLDVTVLPGESQAFKVVAKDQRDREILLDEVIWSANKGIVKENKNDKQEAIYRSLIDQKGSERVHVRATYQGITKLAEANISIPAVLRNINIYPQEISLFPDEKYQFTVVGIDQSDNRIDINFELFSIQWKSSYGGSISASGVFKGGYSRREVIVTANVGGFSAIAKVILRSTLKKLVISPKSVSLKPDQGQQFTVEGFDQYGFAFQVSNITWKATGGTITQSGFFTPNPNVKGAFSVTAIAPDYLLLSENYRIVFYALGLSGHLGSFLLSFNEDFVNHLIARILKAVLAESNTGSQSKILDDNSSDVISGSFDQSSNIFDVVDDPFLLWTSARINRLIARLLEKAGDLCLELAYANISVSAKVEIVGVPRGLNVYPSTRQINEGEKFELIIDILDQYQDDYLTVKWADESLYEQQQLGQLEVIGGKFNKYGVLILGDSGSEAKEVEIILNVYVEVSEGLVFEGTAKITVKKRLVQPEAEHEEHKEHEHEETEKTEKTEKTEDPETSVLTSIKVEPSYIKIKKNEDCQFIVNGFDQFGKIIKIDKPIQWKTTDGNLIPNGEFSIQANLLIDNLLNSVKRITITAYLNVCCAEATVVIDNLEKPYINRFQFTNLVARRAMIYRINLNQHEEFSIDNSQNSELVKRAIYELKDEFETDIDLSNYD